MARESSLVLTAAGATHIGGERANEDEYRYDTELGLLAVAEGMPERPAPRVAAEAAVDALFEYVAASKSSPPSRRDEFERAFAFVNRHVRDEGANDEHLRGMVTTLTCALAVGKLLVVGHVGNGRAMRFRKGRVEYLTVDHFRENLLTRAIGLTDGVVPDVSVEVIQADDGILLATAGLTKVLDEGTIAAILQRASHPRIAVKDLINGALRRGAPRNLTCVFGRWTSPAQPTSRLT